jgi:hypothetical protein
MRAIIFDLVLALHENITLKFTPWSRFWVDEQCRISHFVIRTCVVRLLERQC